MTTFVSIVRQTIRSNISAEDAARMPPIRIAKSLTDRKPKYAHEIEILGPSKLIYSPDKPILQSGARLVLTTESEVKIIK